MPTIGRITSSSNFRAILTKLMMSTVQIEATADRAPLDGELLAGTGNRGAVEAIAGRGHQLDELVEIDLGNRQQIGNGGVKAIGCGQYSVRLLGIIGIFAIVVPLLLRLDVGGGTADRQFEVVGLLTGAAVAQQDIAVCTLRAGDGAIADIGAHCAAAAVDEADRCSVLIEFVLCACGAAVGEGAVLDLDRLRAVCLVVEVDRHLTSGEGAVVDHDLAVGVGVDSGRLGQEVTVDQRDVVLTDGIADVDALEVVFALDRLAVAVGQDDVDRVTRVTLAPDTEVVHLIGGDGDIFTQIISDLRIFCFDLCAGCAAIRIGIHLQIALAIGNVSVVAVDGQVIRDVAVGHGTDVRAGTADDGDLARVGHIRRSESLGQFGNIAALRASLPIHRRGVRPFRLADAGQRQGVILSVERGESSFKRAVGHTANRSDARCKHSLTRHDNGGVLIVVRRLHLVVPKGATALGALSKASSLGCIIYRDCGITFHQAGVNLDSSLTFNRRRSIKRCIGNSQVCANVRSLVIKKNRLTYAVEHTVIECNVLCTVSPDVVGVCAVLIERAAVEGLACSVQEHLTIDGAVVVHQRIGMLNTDIVAVGRIVEGHALEGDLRAVQRHRIGHIKRDIHAFRRFDGECFSGVGQAAIKRILIGSKDRDGLAVLDSLDGLGEGAVTNAIDSCDCVFSIGGFQRKNIVRVVRVALPLQRIGEFDLIAAAILHRRAGGQRCFALRDGVERGGVGAPGVVLRHEVKLGVRAEVQTDVLGAGVTSLRLDIKAVAGGGDSACNIPLRDALKLHGAGAGDGVAGEVDGGQRLEVFALTLVVALRPVAVGGTDPRRVGVVGGRGVGVVRERAAVEGQLLRGDRADDDTVEGAALELQLAQLAPRTGVELVVEAHDVVERDALKGHVGVGGDSQQQGRADVVDAGVAGRAAGDGTVDKNNILAVRAVIPCAEVAVGIVAVQHIAVLGLPRRVVSDAVAEYAVGVVAVVADGDVHRATETGLRFDVRIALHRAQLSEGVGASFGAVVGGSPSLLLRQGSRRQERQRHREAQYNG